MEQARVKPRIKLVWVVAAVIVVGGAWAATSVIRTRGTKELGAEPVRPPENEQAPAGVRVRVEVLNGTSTHGLARRGTELLRDRGFDVVENGNSRAAQDSTVIIDHGSHPDWTARLARALGGARIESQPDTSRYLDITVVLGAAWRSPAKPFYP